MVVVGWGGWSVLSSLIPGGVELKVEFHDSSEGKERK